LDKILKNDLETPVAKENYTGTVNGCGSYGLTFNFDRINAYGFNDCNNLVINYLDCKFV
jgi:hypothetical protein